MAKKSEIYGKSDASMYNLGKYEYNVIRTDNLDYVFCGTNLIYTDLFSDLAVTALEKFGCDPDDAWDNGTAPELRDAFMDAFEKVMGVKFIDVCRTY